VIIATISLVLFGLILNAFLLVAFGSRSASTTSDTLASIVSGLVVSLIVGYVFALKIQEESRTKTVGVIVVLSAFTVMMFIAIWSASPFGYPWEQDFLNSMFNKTTTSWSHYDLNAYAALADSVDVIMSIVISFIGLYVGSMLRKPSAKTEE
jgi:hypothetical protein